MDPSRGADGHPVFSNHGNPSVLLHLRSIDVLLSGLAVCGTVLGFTSIWKGFKSRRRGYQPKPWLLGAKILTTSALFSVALVQLCLAPGPLTHALAQGLVLLSVAAVLLLHCLEPWRIRPLNLPLSVYWLLLWSAHALLIRLAILQPPHRKIPISFILLFLQTGLVAVEFLLAFFTSPATPPSPNAPENGKRCPAENAGLFSMFTFSWMTPIMKHGYGNFLTRDDLWDLRPSDQAKTTGCAFQDSWEKELQQGKPKLWRVLLRAFGGPYLQGSLFKLVGDLLLLVQPQLLRRLIRFSDSYAQQGSGSVPVSEGVFIALSMFGVSLIQTAFNHQNIQRAFETGVRFRSSLTNMLYRKSLKLSNTGKGSKSTGDILNLMVADAQKIQDLAQSGPQLWSAPLQITLCMISLYQLLGPSMFAGVAVMILMSPVSTYISKVLKTLQKRQMKNKDSRMRLITEILRNIKSLKLFAWDKTFLNKLNTVRNDRELKTLRSIGLTQSLANLTWAITPFLVTCTTFTIFVLTSNRPLSSDIVFPALALFNILALPLNIFPLVISSFAEGSVAAARLIDFLCAEEVQPNAVHRQEEAAEVGEQTVHIARASFAWERQHESPVLHDITYAGCKGRLSCVIGRVGSGKSALLHAILGELWKVDGTVSVNGSIAYVAQRPWLLDASVKENIVFGNAWDAQLYERTVFACALSDDFDAFPDRDETEIGERGIQLSGGQKARVALARAVYSCADVFILDDCLSAVDQHVGRHIINHVLGAGGLLAQKTRILATNSIPALREADSIAFLADGRIVEQGTYAQLIEANGETAAMIRNSTGGVDNLTNDGGVVEDHKDSSAVVPSGLAAGAATASNHQPSHAQGLPAQNLAKSTSGQSRAADKGLGGTKIKTSKEASKQGKVEWAVYQQYAQAGGAVAIAVYFAALISAQSASIGGGFWLKHWSEASREQDGNMDVVKYICVYFALGIGSALLVLVQSLVFWMLFSLKASKTLHEQMAVAIFRSPMRYFETTPNGLVINRFSNDIYRIDQNLPRVFNMLFENCAKAFFSLGVIIVSTPIAAALILPLGFLYQSIQKYYLRASRELKRLESGSKSPIFSHYQETLDGLATIRAYQKQGGFSRENEGRIDENIKAFYPSISARRWLGVRLEFIGSVILLAAASSAIFSVYRRAGLSSAMIGLAMSYALQVTQSLNWIVRQGVEAEINIVSAERVLEIARLPSEAPEEIPSNKPPAAWPAEGSVTMVNYSARYRAGLDLALRGINIEIRPREKIGVVGRTGAGKSSLALALFRIIEPAAGQIMIDGLDISKIGLLDLRSRLSIIPQDPALFEGTIRENLDPESLYDDSEIWSALDQAQLKSFVSESQGKLEMEIREGGSNLSQGQRQLVSLARALIRSSSILVLDEATASIDPETDAIIQAMLRGHAFKDRTVVTIAHRISTVLDSDRIIVLDRGQVVEFDTPGNLMYREEGLFYELVKEANLLDTALGQEEET